MFGLGYHDLGVPCLSFYLEVRFEVKYRFFFAAIVVLHITSKPAFAIAPVSEYCSAQLPVRTAEKSVLEKGFQPFLARFISPVYSENSEK